MSEAIRIRVNPYDDPHCARCIIDLLDEYARDPMGQSKPLLPEARRDLIPELRRRNWVTSLLALEAHQPVGLLIAMEGFSTFNCQPLMNIHDVVVRADMRGKGVGTLLFAEVERLARRRGCCKLTLEVLSGNERARRLYSHLGFEPYKLDPENGTAQFWEKPLGGS
jgi:GNAT superfamily N-acetyltransferase